MRIYSVKDEMFLSYGRVIENLDVDELLNTLESISPCPEDGTFYVPDAREFSSLDVYTVLKNNVYGGMDIQIGYCSGENSRLNCLEYHRGSEMNVASMPFVLLLAKVDEIRDGKIDSGNVKAFLVPPRTPVLIYETSLHYAPCGRFKTIVTLMKGTNTDIPDISIVSSEDRLLWARNKWLLAHEETREAKEGAYVGIMGENIDIRNELKEAGLL